MGLSIASRLKAQLKRPAMASQPKEALHNKLNNVTKVQQTEKKPKKWLSNKRKPTGELELFKEIAREQEVNGAVIAKHIDEKTGKECTKLIRTEHLGPENFSHTIPKGRDQSLRLDKSNIEIVSRAWHYKEHNWGILRVKYKN